MQYWRNKQNITNKIIEKSGIKLGQCGHNVTIVKMTQNTVSTGNKIIVTLLNETKTANFT